MTIHEIRTPLAPAEVIDHARSFFTLAGTPHAAFAERSGDGFLKLHMEVGEIVIAALPQGESTWVRGSASRGGHLLTRFLTTLAPLLDARQTVHRHGFRQTRAAQVETLAQRAPTATGSRARPMARAA